MSNEKRPKHVVPATRSSRRSLRFEPLEDRPLLAVFTVTNLDDAAVMRPGDAPGTLRQAVFDANALVGQDSIEFETGLSGTIELVAGRIDIRNDGLTINGPGSSMLTIDGQPTSEIVIIDDVEEVEVVGLTLTGGRGAIDSFDSSLTIRESVISGNNGPASDGGVYFWGAVNGPKTLRLFDSTISGNRGAGIVANEAILDIQSSTISMNEGTAISLHIAAASVVDSTISGNTTSARSGISGSYVGLTLIRSTIDGNAGDGIHLLDSSLTVVGTTISNNTGRGLHLVDTNTHITTSTISGNAGIGVSIGNSLSYEAAIRHSTITGNTDGGLMLGTSVEVVGLVENSILAEHTGRQDFLFPATPVDVRFSMIQ